MSEFECNLPTRVSEPGATHWFSFGDACTLMRAALEYQQAEVIKKKKKEI